MFKYIFLALLSLSLGGNQAYAQPSIDLQNFEVDENILPITDTFSRTPSKRKTRQKSVIPFITSSVAEAAIYNLRNAEQVFCYTLQKRPTNYTGYTLDSFAIDGYCGELDSDQITTAYEALFTQSPNIITTPSNCTIVPKMMLRFVRGVDYTDVLLSSPCPSFTVFYAGKYKAFNIKQGIVDDLIKQFSQKIEQFASPAFLNQTAANAKASNSEEAEKLEKYQRESKPLISWQQTEEENKETAAPSTEAPKPTTSKGWGNLKLKLK